MSSIEMWTSTRVILAVVGFLLFLHPCWSTQNCSSSIVLPELDGPHIWPVNKPHKGFMSSIVESYLSSVQPNPFPRELLITILNSGGINDKATITKVLRYEAGFLVCVAIGIFYIIFMPLIGMCFACCRCCGNCGGHMYQKQTNSINCRRRSIYWVTFLLTIFIFAGNVCMFLSNMYTHESVNSAPGEFNNTLKNLQNYVTSIPKQIDQVENESFVVVDTVTHNIKEIGPLLGKEIQREIEGFVNPALDSAALMVKVFQNTSLLLYTLNSTQKELDLLKSNLTGVKTRLNKTLHNQDCVQCVSLLPELDKLSLNTSINYCTCREDETTLAAFSNCPRTTLNLLSSINFLNPSVEVRRTCILKALCVYLNEKPDILFKEYWAIDDIGIDGMTEIERVALGVYIVRHDGADATDPPEDVGIVIEGCIVLRDLREIANGCAVLFGLMYCLNLSYPKELRYTFEFIQKVLMELDGNKLSTKVQVLKNKLHE